MTDALPDFVRHLLPARGAIWILLLLGLFFTSFGLRLVLGPGEERPLRYHGEFAGTYSPNLNEIAYESISGSAPQTVEERWLAFEEATNPQYFAVRNLPEFDRQPELQHLLRSKYRLLEKTADYLIFDLRSRGK